MMKINSAELRDNIEKYLDLANKEAIVIQRVETDTFALSKLTNIRDADLSRAITADELLTGIKLDIRHLFDIPK
ncbi:MAG: hypothetical protein LBD35_02610 [Prevotellaceae bacterium]|jgi:hypothetical protein|nr:hypothetical protein [Prevotellaceae bacterium]